MPRRVSLPVLPVNRRSFLTRAAAALVALAACGNDTALPSDVDLDAPDAGAGASGADAGDTGAVTGTGIEACDDRFCLDLAHPANAALRDVGGARAFTIGGKKLIVVRTSATEVVALSSVCTHAGCAVKFVPGRDDLECPCHGSTFALDGRVTHGPAATPLAAFAAALDGDEITVDLAG